MISLTRLSPVDHIFTGHGAYPINFVFRFRSRLDPARVKASLDHAVDLFRPFGSRLVPSDPSGRTLSFEQRLSPVGWETRVQNHVPDLRGLAGWDSLLKSVGSVPGEELLHVTLTQVGEESFLGVSGSHCVVDGYSYFLFLTAWSKLFRGEAAPTPVLDRSLLIPQAPISPDSPNSPHSDEVFRRSGFSYVQEKRPSNSDGSEKIQWEVIDFKKSELDVLYQSVCRDTEIRLSLNDVLTAELWKRFTAEHQKPGEKLSLACAFDYRRVYRKLTPLYFGNAIRCASFQMDYEEVQSAPVSEIALKLNHAVKSIDVAAVEDSLQCLESLRLKTGLAEMEKFHVAHPQKGFLLTNLSRLPLLELDFGAGAPVDFRILTPARRTAVVLPLEDGLRVQIAI